MEMWEVIPFEEFLELFRLGASRRSLLKFAETENTDEAAVVDPDLRVRGVKGLRVVDTSIMPELVSGNTNGAAMALAWHAAERIRGG